MDYLFGRRRNRKIALTTAASTAKPPSVDNNSFPTSSSTSSSSSSGRWFTLLRLRSRRGSNAMAMTEDSESSPRAQVITTKPTPSTKKSWLGNNYVAAAPTLNWANDHRVGIVESGWVRFEALVCEVAHASHCSLCMLSEPHPRHDNSLHPRAGRKPLRALHRARPAPFPLPVERRRQRRRASLHLHPQRIVREDRHDAPRQGRCSMLPSRATSCAQHCNPSPPPRPLCSLLTAGRRSASTATARASRSAASPRCNGS